MAVYHVVDIKPSNLSVDHDLVEVEVFRDNQYFQRFYYFKNSIEYKRKELRENRELSISELETVYQSLEHDKRLLAHIPFQMMLHEVPRNSLDIGFCYDKLPHGSLPSSDFEEAVKEAIYHLAKSSNRS